MISNIIFNQALIWMAIAILLRGTDASAWLWGGAGLLAAWNVAASIGAAARKGE